MALDWSDRSLLHALKQTGDPSADQAVEAFDQRHGHPDGVALTAAVMREAAGEAQSADDLLDAFLREQPDWPDWARQDGRVEAGQWFYVEHQWSLQLALLLGSLPLSYCAAAGAEVLARTGLLTREPRRRIFETAALMVELTEDGALEKGGSAYLMVRRLRLLHAAVRRAVEHHELDGEAPGDRRAWAPDEPGRRPVNQLELLGTLWAFAVTSLDVLDRSGLEVGEDERAGWMALWNLVGVLLGIGGPDVAAATGRPELAALLPMTEQEARDCFAAIRAEEFRESEAGAKLAANLIAELHRLMPGRRADRHVDAFVRLYLTDHWAEVLRLAPARPLRLFGPMRWLWRNPGSWGRRLRRPVRRRLGGLHRNLHELLTGRLAEPEVRSYRTDEGDRALGERLVRPPAPDWRAVPQS